MADKLPEGAGAGAGPSSVSSKAHVEDGKNGTGLPDSDIELKSEWVEQDEPGIYITLAALPGGARDIRRVRFSRNRFSETQAEQWWEENRASVYELYNVRVVGKSVAPVGSEWVDQHEPGVQITLRSKTHVEVGKNVTRLPDADSKFESEWVEQDAPGVYITLTALPGGARDLKRVRFSRKRFSEGQAEQWWEKNRARVYQQYNVRVLDKSLT